MQLTFATQSKLSPLYAWQGRRTWRVLATAFGHGELFLSSWAAWQADAQRSAQLHITCMVDQPLTSTDVLAHTPPEWQPMAQALAERLYGLLPGVHRLSFEHGQVLLTLWVGPMQDMLRQQHSVADAVWMPTPIASDAHSIKALARHCQRGTVVLAPKIEEALSHGLQSAGFTWVEATDAALTQGHYAPRWEPRKRGDAQAPQETAGTALVIGAGLAGSSIAHSLALRGWRVTVLAAGDTPADGASGLPAGLFCPHVSPDDSVLSRLSRSGVRMTLQRLRDVCQEGADWGHSGVLEHCTDGGTGLPAHWVTGPGADWSHTTTAEQLQAAGLDDDTAACWHAQAGWVRPAQLVQAQLRHPLIQFQGRTEVARLQATPDGTWQALDAKGEVISQADLAVVACGPATPTLLPADTAWQLQALRGQITWGWHTEANAAALPPFPVNGNGNLVTHVPFEEGRAWIMGSTFERDVREMPISYTDQMAAHAVNYDKLSTLLPHSAPPLASWFTPGDDHCQPTWGRVRVASYDRLPIAGPVSADAPGLWALTAMGARGLTLSVVCGELIAAQLHGEPLPLDAKLAQHLGTERLARQAEKAEATPQPTQ